MQAQITHHSLTRKSIDITVPSTEVAEEFGKVLAKVGAKVRIPGFRPGKAPKDVLFSRYGREIHGEVASNLLSRHFKTAANAVGAMPISYPALEKAQLREGLDGVLTAHFDVAPEVALPDYMGLKLTKKKRLIDEAAVTEHLEALRQQAAKFIPVEEAAAAGHYATLDLRVKPQGMKVQSYKDQVLELGNGSPLEPEILGMKVDETKSFTLTIPESDANPQMAGKTVSYEAKLKDLRKRVVPELNDEFAKDMGDYQDLAALKAYVKQKLEEAADQDANVRAQSTILDLLLEAAPFEGPASMTSLQLDDFCQELMQEVQQRGLDARKINWNAYRQSRMRDAERAVRSGYLLQAIGNAENIQVSDEELEAEIRRIMAENHVQQPFEAFKAELERRGATTEIRGRLRTDKIFERLISSADVTEELLDKAAFEELVELERKREAGLPAARFDAGGLEGGDLQEQEEGEEAAPEDPGASEDEDAKPKAAKKKAAKADEEEAEKPKAVKAAKAEKAEKPAKEEKPKAAKAKEEEPAKPKKAAKAKEEEPAKPKKAAKKKED